MQFSTPQSTSNLSALAAASGKRKKAFLNKFLTKTYHMLDQCPQEIASWSDGGNSFTVKNVDAFEKEVLPKYFNHSKFSSFIRQLNFYGFNKQRSDPDLQTHTKAVRFSHDFFIKGKPDLLHKIQRTTATKHNEGTVSGDAVESLQEELILLRQKVSQMEETIGERVQSAVRSLEVKHEHQLHQVEETYNRLMSVLTLQLRKEWEGTTAPAFESPVAPVSPTLQPAMNLATLADYIRSTSKTS